MALTSLTVLSDRPVLSRFEKGLDGARALNFGLSGGKSCDLSCRYHPKNKRSSQAGRCYAVRVETRGDRKLLFEKMKRHEKTDPAVLCRRALAELQVVYAGGNKVPWFRFSTGGSVPKPKDCTKEFIKAFRDLLDFCDTNNIPVHLPVESMRKYKFYRKIVGGRCTVRLSSGSEKAFINSQVPCSIAVGELGMPRPERIKLAKAIARKHLEETGRKTVVCPAIATSFNGTPHAMSKAKCGACTACSIPGWDIVYPLH